MKSTLPILKRMIRAHKKAQDVFRLLAGGPGSGRHKELHEVVKSFGYSKNRDRSSQRNYNTSDSFSNLKGHTVKIMHDSTWSHFYSKGRRFLLKEGKGANALAKHLAKSQN